MKKLILSFFVVLIFFAFDTFSEEFTLKPLEGSYNIWGKSIVDPASNKQNNTHFYLHLKGEAAKTLYDSMNVEPKYDICLDNGSVVKTIGEMQCVKSKDGQTHNCYFSIDIENQSIESGITC